MIEWDVPAPNWAGARTGGNLSVLDAPSPSVLGGAVGSAAREDARALYDARALSSDGLSKNFRPGSRSNSRGETLDQACRLTDALRIFRRQIFYIFAVAFFSFGEGSGGPHALGRAVPADTPL